MKAFLKYLFLTLLLIFSQISMAAIEGFESYAIFQSRSRAHIHLGISYNWQNFIDPYPTYPLQFGYWYLKNLYFSSGLQLSSGQNSGDRLAYYFRNDWFFGESSSISIKYLHEDWYYIQSAKESIGLELNSSYQILGKKLVFYYAFGAFHRWLKQEWNENTHTPFYFKSDDESGFLTSLLGWLYNLNQNAYGFEVYTRDTFSYYNTQYINAKAYYLLRSNSDILQFYFQVSSSGSLVGTSNITAAELGIQWQNL